MEMGMRSTTTSRWWRWSRAIGERYLRRQVSVWPAAMSLAHPLRPTAGAWHRVVNLISAPVFQASLHFAFCRYDAGRIPRVEIPHSRSPRVVLPAVPRPRFDSVLRTATLTFATRTRIARLDARLESAATVVRRMHQQFVSETERFERRGLRVLEVESSWLRRFQRVEMDTFRTTTVLRNRAQAPAPAAAIESTAEKRSQSPGPTADFSGLATTAAVTGLNGDRLAEQVMDRIDRRMVAWRERIGRA